MLHRRTVGQSSAVVCELGDSQAAGPCHFRDRPVTRELLISVTQVCQEHLNGSLRSRQPFVEVDVLFDAVGIDRPKLDWSKGEQRLHPVAVERYGYEKARRIGMMAMIGGKDKTRIRNATPEKFRDVLLAMAATARRES